MPEELNKPKFSLTGCRYDTVLGDWMMDPDRLDGYVNTAWGIIERGELLSFQARSEDINNNRKEQPYTVVDGLAKMTIAGPMTKLPTSMSSLFGGTSTFMFREGLIRGLNDPSVKGFFIEADSGGGTADGTAELAAAIRKANAVKPVFVHAPDCMASACMWVGSQGKRATAGPIAQVGSVGTMVRLEDTSDRDKAMGRKPIVITTGKYKATTSPPFTPEKLAEVQRNVENMNAVFWGELSAARPQTKAHQADILTARIYIGQEAVKVGLVDGICTTQEAFDYAKQAINNPAPAGRGPGAMLNLPAAPNRSKAMPLTASQLSELRLLPGAAAATEDTADTVAFTAAMQLNRDLTEQRRVGQEQSARLSTLETENRTLKANAPKVIDPEILRGRCETAVERLGIRLEKDKITSAQHGQMAAALLLKGSVKDGQLSADAVPNAALFDKGEDGKYTYEKIFAAFDENAPSGILKDVTGHQPAPRTEPGATEGDAKLPKNFGLAAHNNLREQRGMKPLTRNEFDVMYPEFAGK